jgi:hypothetical protein
MFTKIREATLILSYKEDLRNAPDIVICEEKPVNLPKTSRAIGKLLEATVFILGFMFISRFVGAGLYQLEHPKVASLATVVAALSALLAYAAHSAINKLQAKMQTDLNLSSVLAPYFGRKLHSAIATFRSAKPNA